MKTVLLSLTLFFCLQSFAQSSTSEEEYNYVTKSYKDVIDRGVDLKYSYTVTDLFKGKDETKRFSIDVKALRIGSNVRCLIIVVYDKSGKSDKIFCVPLPGSNDKIIKEYVSELDKLGISKSLQLMTILSALTLDNYQKLLTK